jgi:ribosomal small subunit protein bTHX
MGKGDKRSAKGKRIIGSSGVTRQKKKMSYVATAPTEEKVEKATAKKAAPKKATKKAPAKKAASKKE